MPILGEDMVCSSQVHNRGRWRLGASFTQQRRRNSTRGGMKLGGEKMGALPAGDPS